MSSKGKKRHQSKQSSEKSSEEQEEQEKSRQKQSQEEEEKEDPGKQSCEEKTLPVPILFKEAEPETARQGDSYKVKVGSVVTEVTDLMKKFMHYFEETDAIQKIPEGSTIEISTIQEKTWNQIIEISDQLNYEFIDFPLVTTNDLSTVIGGKFSSFFEGKTISEINVWFKACSYLKFYEFRLACTAAIATRIRMNSSLVQFEKKRKQWGVPEITPERIQELKSRFPFI